MAISLDITIGESKPVSVSVTSKLSEDGTKGTYQITDSKGVLKTSYLYDYIDKLFGNGANARIYKQVAGCGNKYTLISSKNPFYYFVWGSGNLNTTLKPLHGLCGGCPVSNKNDKDISLPDWLRYYSSMRDMESNATTSLTNCVGYANGRTYELWFMALITGLIVYKNGKYYTNTGKELIGGIQCPSEAYLRQLINYSGSNADFGSTDKYYHSLPAPNAQAWTETSVFNGDKYQTEGWGHGTIPMAGAMINWKNDPCGHIAFVEEVGVDDNGEQYIIISESGWGKNWAKDGVFTNVQKLYKNKRTGNFDWSASYPFKSFLYTPVTQIFGDGGAVNIETVNLSEEAQKALEAAYKRLNAEIAYTELKNSDSVYVKWVGNSQSDGKGKVVHQLAVNGIVKQIKPSAEYPYQIKLKSSGEVLGWFKRDALKKLNGEDTINI